MSYGFYARDPRDEPYWDGPAEEPPEPMTLQEIAEDAMHDAQEHEIDHEELGCQCYMGGLYSLGSVESIKCGDTDPYCPQHGVDEVRSGQYAQWTPAQRAEFDRRLGRQLRDA